MGKISSLLTAGSLTLLVVVGCSVPDAKPDASADRAQRAVIGHLRTRDEIITVHSSHEGPTFTIETMGGTRLEQDLSYDELQAARPGVHAIIQRGVAQEKPVLDASLWPHAPGTWSVPGERELAPGWFGSSDLPEWRPEIQLRDD